LAPDSDVIVLAAQLDTSTCVPLLRGEAYRSVTDDA